MNYDQIVKALDRINIRIRWGITALICVVILVGYYGLLRIPAEQELDTLAARGAELDREFAEKRSIADDLKNYQERVRQLEAQLQEALKKLPEKIGFDQLIVVIPNIAKKNNQDVLSFELGDESVKTEYVEVPIEIKMQGSYFGLARFVQEVGEHQRIMRIQDMKLERAADAQAPAAGDKKPAATMSDERKDWVTVTAQLIAYRFKGAADSGGKPAAGAPAAAAR